MTSATKTSYLTDRRLKPRTEAGECFVQLCEQHAETFAARAGQHDRDGSFAFENWDDMKASGILRACVPAVFGGLGVTSVHDVAVGISRLAEGDASAAIGANMHLSVPWIFGKRLEDARSRGDEATAARLEMSMQFFANAVFAGPSSEAGNDVFICPVTTATPVDGGYRIDGRKTFGTNSPVADIFGVFLRLDREDGPHMGFAIVGKGTPGMTVHDDWDALGMRASGSGSVTFENCVVSAAAVTDYGRAGVFHADGFQTWFAVAFPLIGTFVGIAEAALDLARENVRTKTKGPSGTLLATRHGIQQQIAEAEVELAIARGSLARAGQLIDEYFDAHPVSTQDVGELHEIHLEMQCANIAVKRSAVAVVDRAMNAVGGASYMSGHPLARYWRDVRAGSFMQPFTPVEAYSYIASVALGLPPTYDGRPES